MAGITIKTSKRVIPQCYAYVTPGVPSHDGWTKIGYTERDVETRIKEQTHTVGVAPVLKWHMRAAYMTDPYGTFTDKDFHAYLKKLAVPREEGTEWFQISPDKAKMDFVDFTQNHGNLPQNQAKAAIPYVLREEQNQAVEQTLAYFKKKTKEAQETHKNEDIKFLWNAKPRFGKTLTAYDLCRRLNAHNILVVTNRPAIANSWYADYETFFGPQSGYLFVSTVDGIKDKPYVFSREQYLDKTMQDDSSVKGCIEFVSLQDLKGSIYFGGHYEKLKEVEDIHWDILIIDEAHEGVATYKTDTAFSHIHRKYTLHLSGTPFKALANEVFPADAIFNWTYADEQRKKRDWDDSNELENPYENLPCLRLFTYQMSEIVRDKAAKGIELADQDIEEYAFDLNEFFQTTEAGKFVHEKDVDRFLDALTHQEKFPFSTPELRNELKHTLWLLNRVASAKALAKKLKEHPVFKDYEIVLAAGDGKLDDDAETQKSFDRVVQAIHDHDKTITLSVGQLTTGVTIPQWTAVLMLSNVASPALYMQAAFRAQNPCLFHNDLDDTSYRKENAYVFDFDPARTLTIYEQFANDLIPETSGSRGTTEERKHNIRELLNFFPVYGEDDQGSMLELDAESVLTIPRHIHAREVVDRGFMSNFLFANISGIFSAPKEIIDAVNNLQALEQPKTPPKVDIGEDVANSVDENGDVKIAEDVIIGKAQGIFGKKVYGETEQNLDHAADVLTQEPEKPKENDPKEEIKKIHETFAKPIVEGLMGQAQKEYGREMKKSTQNRIGRNLDDKVDSVVKKQYGEYHIQHQQLEQKRDEDVKKAQQSGASMEDITKIENDFQAAVEEKRNAMVEGIKEQLQSHDFIEDAAQSIVKTVETEKVMNKKQEIEGHFRDHLRGFARTIPAFLMAYGNDKTTLANFDQLVPEKVFLEVTTNPQTGEGVSLELFRKMRDGYDYYERDENGKEIKDEAHKKHFEGHLFDELVFNDSIQEFMKRRKNMADYFDENSKGDIFDYIPPQRTNQIFTPKKVVVEMVDQLEKANPGCFDNPDATFADLYMKSGMYITEIVKRLYRSKRMKQLFPDDGERLNHIFAKQVFGCAPTEIIYRICLRYILGFDDAKTFHITKNNIKLCDTLQLAKAGTMEGELKKLFGL